MRLFRVLVVALWQHTLTSRAFWRDDGATNWVLEVLMFRPRSQRAKAPLYRYSGYPTCGAVGSKYRMEGGGGCTHDHECQSDQIIDLASLQTRDGARRAVAGPMPLCVRRFA